MKCTTNNVIMTFSNADYSVNFKVGEKLWFLEKAPEYVPRQGTLETFNVSTILCEDGLIKVVFSCQFKERSGVVFPIEHIRATKEELKQVYTDHFEDNAKDLTIE